MDCSKYVACHFFSRTQKRKPGEPIGKKLGKGFKDKLSLPKGMLVCVCIGIALLQIFSNLMNLSRRDLHSMLCSGQEGHFRGIEDDPFDMIIDEATVRFFHLLTCDDDCNILRAQTL